jgi:DNA-binding transcriptional MerR regulator
MDTDVGYTLQGLADASGIPVRTLRYYLAQGLLPAPARQGRLTRYPGSTLRRLVLVKRLRAANLPLADIRDRLSAMPDAEVEAALGPRGMAKQLELRTGLDVPPVYTVRPPGVSELPAAYEFPSLLSRDVSLEPRAAERTQWERIAIEPGVELHVQRPLTRLAAKRVERLVAHARELLERDMEGIGR